MPLPPFRTTEGTYESSIALDASTVKDTTVTVAVATTRREEIEILESIYDYRGDLDFKPFYHKAWDFDGPDYDAFVRRLLQAHADRLAAFVHRDGAGADTERIEAVHSAIHVHDQLATPAESVVLIDGARQQAEPFVRALEGLRTAHPPITNCLQCEYYYPAGLLADLTANHLATAISRGDYEESSIPLSAPDAKQTRGEQWGQAMSSSYRSDAEYASAGLPSQRGNTVRERVCCWFDGTVARDKGVDPPFTDSVNRVVKTLRREGYTELASILNQL